MQSHENAILRAIPAIHETNAPREVFWQWMGKFLFLLGIGKVRSKLHLSQPKGIIDLFSLLDWVWYFESMVLISSILSTTCCRCCNWLTFLSCNLCQKSSGEIKTAQKLLKQLEKDSHLANISRECVVRGIQAWQGVRNWNSYVIYSGHLGGTWPILVYTNPQSWKIMPSPGFKMDWLSNSSTKTKFTKN